MKTIRRIVSMLLCVLLLCGVYTVVPFAADLSRPQNAHLAFGQDGKLKILQVADLQDDAELSDSPKRLLRAAMESLRPDLVMLTGDNIAGYDCLTKQEAEKGIRAFMDIFAEYDTPVAAVFGNHDDDRTAFTKEEQMAVYTSYDCFIGCEGLVAEKTVDGRTMRNVGTYNIPVYASADSSDVAFNIWCFDSGNYNPDPEYGSYGYVLPEQVDWYVQTSVALQEANGGKLVPSVAFQHIAPPQIFKALREVSAFYPGAVSDRGKYYALPVGVNPLTNWMKEAPCPPDPAFADGYRQLDAMIERGDVRAVFYGHDHVNHYVVPYEGIDLVSSVGCTYQSYNNDRRGFRLIVLDRDQQTYTSTYHSARTLLAGSWFRLSFRAFFERIWAWVIRTFVRRILPE